MRRASMVRLLHAIILAIVLQATASAQTHQQPVTAKLCEVVASPNEYDDGGGGDGSGRQLS